MRTHNIPPCYRKSKRDLFCLLSFINPHWLELSLSRTNFHGPKVFEPLKFDCICSYEWIKDCSYVSPAVRKCNNFG